MTARGSYVHNFMVEFSGASRKCEFYAIFSENWWFQTKRFTGLLELIKIYKQNPPEKFFIFTIYPNYALALNTVIGMPKSKSYKINRVDKLCLYMYRPIEINDFKPSFLHYLYFPFRSLLYIPRTVLNIRQGASICHFTSTVFKDGLFGPIQE